MLFLSCSGKEWYEKLPTEVKPKSEFKYGVYKKKVYSRKPMLSVIFQDSISESFIFNMNGSLQKSIEISEVNYGTKKIIKKIAIGNYKLNGNWILVIFPNQSLDIIEEGEIKIKNKEKFPGYELLYYYEPNKKFIIPMKSEKLFKLDNFGVKDFINNPYNENEKQFLNAIKIYSEKENISHAYYFIEKK